MQNNTEDFLRNALAKGLRSLRDLAEEWRTDNGGTLQASKRELREAAELVDVRRYRAQKNVGSAAEWWELRTLPTSSPVTATDAHKPTTPRLLPVDAAALEAVRSHDPDDAVLAARFAVEHRDKLRFIREWHRWFLLDAGRWRELTMTQLDMMVSLWLARTAHEVTDPSTLRTVRWSARHLLAATYTRIGDNKAKPATSRRRTMPCAGD